MSSNARFQVLLASLCFGTTGTAQALGPDGLSPAGVGAGRILVGGGLLVLVALLAGGRQPVRPERLRGAGRAEAERGEQDMESRHASDCCTIIPIVQQSA
jgi:hypothetical protein